MSEFETSIEIEEVDFLVNVQFDYQEGEPETRLEPGCDPEVDITSIMVLILNFELNNSDLMTTPIREDLQNKALDFIANELEAYEEEKAEYMHNQQREAA